MLKLNEIGERLVNCGMRIRDVTPEMLEGYFEERGAGMQIGFTVQVWRSGQVCMTRSRTMEAKPRMVKLGGRNVGIRGVSTDELVWEAVVHGGDELMTIIGTAMSDGKERERGSARGPTGTVGFPAAAWRGAD